MSTTETIITRREDRVLEIYLNRPEQLNAFNQEMHHALHQALHQAHHNKDIRAVLITGNGRGFCAGQDLGDRNPDNLDTKVDLELTIAEFYNPTIRLIRSLAKPVVVAVNGVAAGAGANIAFGCDIVLAAKSARFIQSFSKVGLVPDAGGTWLLPRLIGEMRAKAWTMTAQPLAAEQAQEWGLVWEVVPDDELLQHAQALTRELAQGATLGLGLTKSLLQDAANNSFDQQITLEARAQGEAGRSADYAAGVRAFLHKRKPDFQGR